MYLTRNQAGVYSASGVRIPPSPPDKRKGLPKGSPFLLSGAGHDARFARRPTRCVATRGPLPLPASPRPCRGSPSTEGLVPPDDSMSRLWAIHAWRGSTGKAIHAWRGRDGHPHGVWIHARRGRQGHSHRAGTDALCEWRVLRTCSPAPAVCRSGSGRRAVRPRNQPSPTGACWHGWSRPGSRPGPAHRRAGCWH